MKGFKAKYQFALYFCLGRIEMFQQILLRADRCDVVFLSDPISYAHRILQLF